MLALRDVMPFICIIGSLKAELEISSDVGFRLWPLENSFSSLSAGYVASSLGDYVTAERYVPYGTSTSYTSFGVPTDIYYYLLERTVSSSDPFITIVFHTIECIRVYVSVPDQEPVVGWCYPKNGLCTARIRLPREWFMIEQQASVGFSPDNRNCPRNYPYRQTKFWNHRSSRNVENIDIVKEPMTMIEVGDAFKLLYTGDTLSRKSEFQVDVVMETTENSPVFVKISVKSNSPVRINSFSHNPDLWNVRSSRLSREDVQLTMTLSLRNKPSLSNTFRDRYSSVVTVVFQDVGLSDEAIQILWQIDSGSGPFDVARSDSRQMVLTVFEEVVNRLVVFTPTKQLANTALLDGKQIHQRITVAAVTNRGSINDVTNRTECVVEDNDVLQVSSECSEIVLTSNHTKGLVDARVRYSYKGVNTTMSYSVWVPELPVQVKLQDWELNAHNHHGTADQDTLCPAYQSTRFVVLAQFTAIDGKGNSVNMSTDCSQVVNNYVTMKPIGKSVISNRNMLSVDEDVVPPARVGLWVFDWRGKQIGQSLAVVAGETVSVETFKAQLVTGLKVFVRKLDGLVAVSVSRIHGKVTNHNVTIETTATYSDGTECTPLFKLKSLDENILVAKGHVIIPVRSGRVGLIVAGLCSNDSFELSIDVVFAKGFRWMSPSYQNNDASNGRSESLVNRLNITDLDLEGLNLTEPSFPAQPLGFPPRVAEPPRPPGEMTWLYAGIGIISIVTVAFVVAAFVFLHMRYRKLSRCKQDCRCARCAVSEANNQRPHDGDHGAAGSSIVITIQGSPQFDQVKATLESHKLGGYIEAARCGSDKEAVA